MRGDSTINLVRRAFHNFPGQPEPPGTSSAIQPAGERSISGSQQVTVQVFFPVEVRFDFNATGAARLHTRTRLTMT
ncbi:hypothetical protein FA13DRAFT_1723620 [Coprinellus micaceus]|uniref:Uncharacterized protein n=1 Tax=Coprinellus micaceus TaxID=71717 RepID=A0A4Y7TZK4_COPMI|nr:hypothetical protein FA13DRAFT_1723620 [Coprinellus micaceus]